MAVGDMYARYTRVVLVCITGALLALHGGCADYVPEKATELQARSILNNLSRIQPVPDPNVPVPEVYKSPPRIVEQTVGGSIEFKLFYFCRHHRADQLQAIVQAQFASTLFGKIGQETSQKDYTVTSNPATNQLIVRCPTRDDVTAVLELLESADVPPIQVKIDCLISELYADLTMDKEITLEIENFLGESIALGGKQEGGVMLPAFPGAALREPARGKFGLKVGFGHQIGIAGHQFRALVDLLISRGYLKILMNPTLEVVNGQPARIETMEHVPLQRIEIRGWVEDAVQTRTEYYDVIDSLQITPHVFADGYIGLETSAKISAKLTPEGIVQTPIVTERTIANKENRIRHGESLVIGGIRKSEKRDVIRGVPVLKDIPVVGGLFSGRDFEERAKEVIFILTPTISTGGIPNKEMVEQIREKHEPPIPYEELHRAILDPFGFDTHERERQRQLLEAEEARMQAEAEKARARMEVRQATAQAETARQQAIDAQAELERLRLEAEKARLEAAKIKAEADLLTAEAAKAKAEADKLAAEAGMDPNKPAPAPDPPQDSPGAPNPPDESPEAPKPAPGAKADDLPDKPAQASETTVVADGTESPEKATAEPNVASMTAAKTVQLDPPVPVKPLAADTPSSLPVGQLAPMVKPFDEPTNSGSNTEIIDLWQIGPRIRPAARGAAANVLPRGRLRLVHGRVMWYDSVFDEPVGAALGPPTTDPTKEDNPLSDLDALSAMVRKFEEP